MRNKHSIIIVVRVNANFHRLHKFSIVKSKTFCPIEAVEAAQPSPVVPLLYYMGQPFLL